MNLSQPVAIPPATTLEKPTTVRYGVLAFACVLSMITYLDRVCMSTVALFIRREFGLDAEQLGYIFGAFTLSYALFEVPSGWLGDVFGPRKTLVRIVLWWSTFTVLTAIIYPSHTILLVGSVAFGVPFLALLAVRLFFGLGEAGAYPNIARAFHNWFPFQERGSVKGAVWMAGRFAGGVTPFIVLALIQDTVTPGTHTIDLAKKADVAPLLTYSVDDQAYRAIVEARPTKDGQGTEVLVNGLPVEADSAQLLLDGQPVAKAQVRVTVATNPPPTESVVRVINLPPEKEYAIEFSVKDMANTPARVALVVTAPRVTSWRHTFWIFGGLGVVWCVAFWWWFRDRPEEKHGVNAAEVALIHAGDESHGKAKIRVPWGRLLGSANLWLLCGMYFCGSYGWYFNITYLPAFLEDRFGLLKGAKWTPGWWQFSFMSGLPLLTGSVACLVGGLLTDRFIRRTGNRKWGRRIFGIVGHGLCAVCYFLALLVIRLSADGQLSAFAGAWLFALAIGLAAFCNDMTMGSAWASCLDIGGRFSGIVAGCMNTIGNLGGFVANVATGLILSAYTSRFERGGAAFDQANLTGWTVNFIIFGIVYAIAVCLWLNFDATHPVAPETEEGV